MLSKIIHFSIKNKLIIGLFTLALIIFGIFSLTRISIGAVPDITNNQVQVITTSRNLSTEDIEQFITYPVELEMANLPGVLEIRSISKFGLSVVTVVFEEDMGMYLPRQLIAEKLKSASENIPEGFGTPEMGPITTGLGEIYQYVLDVEPQYKDTYSLTDLRTIQDWIIKRQLSGIPGVVEVNTWGGHLKQYEVAINTHKLNAMGVTVGDIYTALERNNSISGGGYIEKSNQAYFIRGEGLVTSLEDIRNIVVRHQDGMPIYVNDVAKVQLGHAMRFGAITGNGEGEKVLGQIMMIKEGHSDKVIAAIQKRVAEISSSLPEGVTINPFLDRSILIEKTTHTIAENLIIGILIVIFVVVLLLGNLRSGLVVASVIPLSLLFTLSMMYLFKIDANLMSLGAIDFGIIIDGAVIIVEFVAFQINKNVLKLKSLSAADRREAQNQITQEGTSKMMNAAVFGQLIILIVFIPILTLSGVEGKMFGPMALTFSFAMLGTMVLCFTYVPVASALFLKPVEVSPKNISVRLMNFLNRVYDPVIRWALRAKRVVIAIAVLMLVVTAFIFSTMGSEFIPTLDEGDYVIQPVLKTGTSLTNTIEITTQIEQLLLQNFPDEVNQVITRIGAAEVPTDPMSMEETDVIITLKPIKEWTVAASKNELAEKFEEALAVIPGMGVEFTQPIEMRFNELITGVRADIAIKIFGEDLDILDQKARQIKNLIEDVAGADDITVEKVAGLPEMKVKFDRSKIARYGLNIDELNQTIAMGFAGRTVGSIFEGEKRFDLVMRLEKDYRKDISNLENLYVDTPAGDKVPLRELATITYSKGAAQISRDDTKRRIVVGINVRNRDLQGVVDDVQQLVKDNVKLPVGYSIDYGGQFENLQSAKKRLFIAVPIALLLIFVMLYFAFNSVREALMIYSAIPLSAVGGVFLLWLRDMPLSISAGVGFIALFGVAVLNGIILIEHFKELKKEGMTDINRMIVQGSKSRLRAVLLTASSTALGFLPMAISTSAGAEIQRPLATVVIGGMATAFILTLIVLPVLYSIFGKDEGIKIKKQGKTLKITLVLIFFGMTGMAQEAPKGLQELQQIALENNLGLQSSMLQRDEAEALINSAFNLDKTSIFYEHDQNNMAPNNLPLEVFGVQQDINFPTVYFAERKLNRHHYDMQSSQHQLQIMKTKGMVAAAYYQFQYESNKAEVYRKLDSLYQNFAHAAQRRFELGETNYLEKITARAKQRKLEMDYRQSQEEVVIAHKRLEILVQSEDELVLETAPLKKIESSLQNVTNHPATDYYEYRKDFYRAKQNLERQHLLPDLSFSYAIGSNASLNRNLNKYQVGLKIPLFFGANASKIKASRIAVEISEQQAKDFQLQFHSKREQLIAELSKYEAALQYYEEEGKSLSEEILRTAIRSFKNGEIDFFQYIQSLENVYDIELEHLDHLNNYNQTVISITYLTL